MPRRYFPPMAPATCVVLACALLIACQSESPEPTAADDAATATSAESRAVIPEPAPIAADDGIDPLSNESHNAAVTLRSLSEDAFSLLSDPLISETERKERFRLLFTDGFDLPTIGRFVLGSHWDGASGVQRRLFLQLYEDLIVNSYADRFRDYSGQDFRIIDAEALNPAIQRVGSEIVTAEGETVTVDWTMRRSDFGYQVVDVAVGGVSLGRTQRDEYDSVVQRDGLSGLLDVLQERVAALES